MCTEGWMPEMEAVTGAICAVDKSGRGGDAGTQDKPGLA